MNKAPELPKLPGAYALLIQLPAPLQLPIARLGRPTLAPGPYVYCGSAYGPGGLAARVGRHLRRGKSIRWHVDHLTERGEVLDVLCVPDGSECELVRRLGRMAGVGTPLAGVGTPLAGFGSSDCQQCASHLLSVPVDFDLAVQMK
ncbi:MAG: GIY-YIG nuclease family protein [Rhodospirillaceae bacterium]|jgi:Uri superfamily endonuclease|nr:GIY-YIG nuclease family protein [Rhodospirillaceae bacterium]